jgi:hypothetical protein
MNRRTIANTRGAVSASMLSISAAVLTPSQRVQPQTLGLRNFDRLPRAGCVRREYGSIYSGDVASSETVKARQYA